MVDLPERQRDSRDLSDRGRRQDEHRKTRGYDVTERRGNPRQDSRHHRDEYDRTGRRHDEDRGRNRSRSRDYSESSRRRSESARYSDRDGGRQHEERPGKGWRCPKCDARNDGRNETCSKCRPSNGREMQRGRRRSSSDDEYERTNKRDRDQLGSSRASSDGENGDKGKKRKSARSRSASPVPPPKPIKDASQWPPRFESHGSRYVFDTRSEMFYEAISDFFYDPKSKLYYGNKQGAYFKKNEGGDDGSPSFIEVEKVATDAASQSTDLCVTRPSETISAEGRKRIAINLKTKALGGESSATGARAKGKAFAPKTHKKQMANIAKWNIQEKSKRDELVAAKPLANKVGEKIVRTVKGEPVCVLCQRKFKSLEKLRLHERLSRMHGANLAKQALDQADGKRAAGRAQAKPAQSYVDRAQKRRDLHFGTDSNFVAQASPLGPTMMFADVPIKQESDPESPERDGLGMGKRMLEKLGWKQEPTEDDDGGAPAVKVKVESTHDRIRKDWDRIESLANK